MIGLPDQFFGVIHDCASVSSLCAMAAARESMNLKVREKGMVGRGDLPRLRMYASEEAHSSIEKAAIVLGIGQEGLRKIPTDDVFRMKPDSLEQAMKEDVDAGIRPTCVIATIGTTSTTSVDPVKEIAELCNQYGVWLHVDAAYGGAAAVLDEMRPLFDGWERADSVVVNPHKWLFTPIDCSALYCRRPEVLKRAFSLIPEYLTSKDEATNFMDYGVSLGRRFRALKLWMVIRSLGREGIANTLRRHISYAQKLSQLIKASSNFELLAPVPFSTLVFRCRRDGSIQESQENLEVTTAFNERLLEEVNDTGKVFLSHTKLRGRFGIRLTIGNIKTTWTDVALAWKIIQQKARELEVK
jgi:aromatic-L-amino-acid decarboxylase